MDIKRILWPTDFSQNASRALPYVQLLSEQFNAEIHILYVLKEYIEFGACYGGCDPKEDYEKMRAWEKETAEKRLEELCTKHLDTCPLFFRHIGVGDPAKEILKVIKTEKIDAVIMANRGSEDHFDFGSVADRVLKGSSVPVVLIPV